MTLEKVKELMPKGGWNLTVQPRLLPLQDQELSFYQRMLMKVMVAVGTANCTNLYRTAYRNLRLFLPFAMLNARMMPKGTLTRRQTELAILRVGWLSKSRYEWGQHVDIGLRAGLTAKDIMRVSQGPDADGWSEVESAIIRAADELHENRMLSESTWSVLSNHFDEKKMIELIMLIGCYGALAGLLNSAGVQLETSVAQIMKTTPIHNFMQS